MKCVLLDHTPAKSVLFLCTGNYYRSRFAEELFNHRVERDGLRWTAYSRGLATERGIFNLGPMSAHVVEALAGRGLAPRSGNRAPQQCTRADLQAADHIVALKEAEHRPLVIERFPEWEDRIEYWHVHDATDTAPAVALSSIAEQIDLLLDRLSGGNGENSARRAGAARAARYRVGHGRAIDARPFACGDAHRFAPNWLLPNIFGKARMPRAHRGRRYFRELRRPR